jgi:hypothetical protein
MEEKREGEGGDRAAKKYQVVQMVSSKVRVMV